MTPTTRRYPRTLDDAFKGARYAGPIETPNGHIIGYGGAMRPRKKLPTVVALDNSLLARVMRILSRLWGRK